VRFDARRVRFDAFFFVLVVLAIAKATLARSLILHASPISIGFILEAAGILFVLALADVLSPRRSYTVEIVVFSLLSVVMLANVIYVSVFGQIVDPSMLAIAGQTAEVTDSVTSILRPVYLLFVLDVPLLIAAAIYLRRTNRGPTGRSLAVGAALLVAAVVFTAQIVWVRTLPAGTDGLAVAKGRGLAAYQVSTLIPRQSATLAMASSKAAAGTNGVKLTPGQQVQLQVEEIRQAEVGTRTVGFPAGAYSGKNIIVVQVEALNGFVVGNEYEGQPITPNIDKLIKTSWYFPNTYSQTSSGNTADAEFISSTSLYAPQNRPASTAYSVYEIPALPRLLKTKGYTSLTFHTNYVKMWNRGEMYASLGFDRYYDRPFFKNEDIMWRSSDQVLFKRGTAEVRSVAESTPVYAQFVTITSHSPFKYPWANRRVITATPQDQLTTVGRYIQSISYADKAVGELVAELKEDGLYDNSIIILAGDHTAMSKDTLKDADEKLLKELIGRPYNQSDLQRVGMVIHLPGQTKPALSKSTLGTADVMPTIADLVGLDLSGTPHMGKSAFINSKAFVPTRAFLPAGSFINDKVVFEPQLSFDDGRAYSIVDGSPVKPTEQERSDYERAVKLSALSDEWLKSLPRRANAAAKQDKGF
jgi:phosphoglycerol transferase MdoB-like AlkP superfamily enzyme